MTFNLKDIHSLSDFKRQTPVFSKKLKKTGNPIVLTVNGHSEFVVQDAIAYQAMINYISDIESIKTGLREAKEGLATPFESYFDELVEKVQKKKR